MSSPRAKVFMYSHTHWDREWYLSQTQFQYRLIRTLDEIVEVLLADNSFETFVLDGQTSIVEDYLDLRPERRELLTQLISDGKIVIGPWFTMPDMFLPDGEALVRNLLRGYRDCRAFGGRFPNTGYVPDSFGHIEQVPQILRGVGIDNYVFSRGRPASIAQDRGWKREFIWQAPDGSKLFALPICTSYTEGKYLPGPDNPETLRERVQKVIDLERNSHRTDIALLPHGADHSWLQRNVAEIIDAIPRLMPEIEFHHGSLQDAVDAWKGAIPDGLSTYSGQLRGRLTLQELHGTLSSRIDNKLMNESAQMHLENLAEPLHAVAHMFGRQSTPWFFKKAWELLFQNHAHDSICGCSRDRVHTDVNTRFREVIELSTDIADSALDYLNSPARRDAVPTLIVYAGLNGGNQVVDFLIKLEEKPDGQCCFADESGTRHCLQWTSMIPLKVQHGEAFLHYWECRGCVYIPDLKPCEVRKLVFRAGQSGTLPCPGVETIADNSLTNGLLQVHVNANGTVNLRNAKTGWTAKNTHYFVQEGDQGGGYHFEPIPNDHRRDTREQKAEVKVLAKGPLRGRVEVSTKLRVPARLDHKTGKRTGQRTLPVQTIFTVEAGSPLVKCHTCIENTAGNQRIRLALPTGLNTRTVHADASFAVHANAVDKWPADAGQNFHPMRNFVSIHEQENGLAFLGKGLHEYEIVPTNAGTRLEVTFLRSFDFVMLCCTWATPEAQLMRPLDYDYALTLHERDWNKAQLPGLAAAFRNPPVALVHGDFAFPNEHEPHTTVGYYAQLPDGEIPVDSNRSTWKLYNAHRDGWRRVERERFVQGEIDNRILPFEIDGSKLVISAFKESEDGNGQILRFWSYEGTPQTVCVRASTPNANLVRCNLLEQPQSTTESNSGSLELTIKPFEIATVKMTPTRK
ncbi:MAG: hypothetical protein K9N51_12930 [Candidatus Pacebacteria bacterium]|nr:hypothetical protein [Candidatus Paceibacterota bacterium]